MSDTCVNTVAANILYGIVWLNMKFELCHGVII